MRIHFYTKYDRQGASSRYRTFQYLSHYHDAGIETRTFPLFSEAYLRDRYAQGRTASNFTQLYRRRWADMDRTSEADLVVVEKELLPYLPAWFEKSAFRNAKRVLLDYDDAVFENYRRHPNTLVRWLLGGKIDELMARADGVIAGSRYLRDYAEGHARETWLVPTTVDVEKYALHDHDHEGLVTIGWIGTPWSSRYLPVVRRALERVASEVSIRFIIVGGHSPLWEGVNIQAIPWSEDTEADLIRWMDIGIMPLIDHPFERGKCGLKLLQYMAGGVVPVASDVGGNRDLIQHGEDGFLCRREEEWIETLLHLARNPAARAEIGLRGRKKVEEQYSLQVWGPRLETLYRGVAEGKSPVTLVKESPAPESKPAGLEPAPRPETSNPSPNTATP